MFAIGKKLKDMLKSLNKAEHSHLAKAICAAGVLMANASGGIDEGEVNSLKDTISLKPNLSAFSGDVGPWIDDRALLISKSAFTGSLQLLKEIEACAGNKDEALQVLAAAMDVAAADGNIDDKEEAMANKIAAKLGVRLSDLA